MIVSTNHPLAPTPVLARLDGVRVGGLAWDVRGPRPAEQLDGPAQGQAARSYFSGEAGRKKTRAKSASANPNPNPNTRERQSRLGGEGLKYF